MITTLSLCAMYQACKSITKICAFLILLFFFKVPALHSQETQGLTFLRAGVFAGAQAMVHNAEFRFLAGFPSCCPLYTSGSGSSPILGVNIEFPSSKNLRHSVRASYGLYGGTLSAIESTPVVVGGALQTARILHTLRTNIPALEIEPAIHADITRKLGVFGGFRCSFLLNGTLEQYEELVTPNTGTFENNSRIRNRRSGTIFALQPLMASVVLGMRTTLPLNSAATYLLVPEISAALGLSSLTGNEEWRVHTIRAGISLIHQWPANNRHTRDSATLDVLCNLSANDGQRDLSQSFMGVKIRSRRDVVSLLPVVFFDSSATSLARRWVVDTSASMLEVNGSSSPALAALNSSHKILSVIGIRLRNNNTAILDIVGVRDTMDEVSAGKAMRRCETLARILDTTFGIARSRMRLRVATAQALGYKDASMLRHGVVLLSSPVVMTPLKGIASEHTWTPSLLRIRPQLRGTDEIKEWEIRISLNNQVLRVFRGTTSFPASLVLDIRDHNVDIQSDDSLIVDVITTGVNATAASTRETMPVRVASNSADSVLTIVQLNPGVTFGAPSIDAMRSILQQELNTQNGGSCSIEWTPYDSNNSSGDVISNLRSTLSCSLTETPPTSSQFISIPYPEAKLLNSSMLLRWLRAR